MTGVAKNENIEAEGIDPTEVYLYRDQDGGIPLLEWLDGLQPKARVKCADRIPRLAELGNELRRPEADFPRDGVYELRASFQGIHYRLLYFFTGKAVVVLSHGLTKERDVPNKEIDRAVRRKKQVEGDFKAYTVKPA